MSFWDILGDIGGAIAAPFTGGLSLLAGPLIHGVESATGGDSGSQVPQVAGNLSQVLGGAAGGLAAQQGQQGQLAGIQGNLQQQLYNDAVNRFLTQRVTLPTQGADMARRGDLQANVQDMRPNMTPGAGYSFSGGLRPSALGPNARAAGQNLSQMGLNLQSAGNQMPALPNFPNVPTQPSGFQQALQIGALGSGVLGAFQKNPIQQWLASQSQGGGSVPTYGPPDPYANMPPLPEEMG